MLTVECGVCFSHLFITWTSFLPVFTEKKKKKKKKNLISSHGSQTVAADSQSWCLFFCKYQLEPLFLCLARLGGGEYKKTHVSNVSSTLEPEICHVASKWAEKIPSQGQETNNIYLWCWQTAVSCRERRKYVEGAKRSGAALPAKNIQHPHEGCMFIL